MAKKRGRPKGSKNRVYRHAKSVMIPASCPTCKSTELTRIRGSKVIERQLRGVLESGHTYHKVMWARHLCDKCGQFVMVRRYVGEAKDNTDVVEAPKELT